MSSYSSLREAWHKLGELVQESAMQSYISIVDRVDPNWDTVPLDESKLTKKVCLALAFYLSHTFSY